MQIKFLIILILFVNGLTILYLKNVLRFSWIKVLLILVALMAIMIPSTILLISKYGYYNQSLAFFLTVYVLALLSIHDVISKTIPLNFLITSYGVALILLIFNPNINTIEILIGTLVILVVLLIVSYVTRNSFEKGDAIMLGLVCLINGWQITLTIFIFALMLSGLIGIFLVISKRATKKTKVAFLPFILIATLITFLV